MPQTFAIALAMLLLGVATGYYFRYLHALSKKRSLEIDIKEREVNAEKKALETIEKAEAKAATIEQEAKQERKNQEEKLSQKETHLLKREEMLDSRQIDLDSQKELIQTKITEIKSFKAQLDERKNDIEKKLEEVAGLTQEQALEKVIARVEAEHSEDLRARVEKLDRQSDEAYEAKASNILLAAIHRVGNNIPSNVMTSHVEIPSDDLKGKVIGKEGRNVRAFERATGVDVLIDETPGYIVLSSFDPIRREIARVALEVLLKDGRIQPAKIEEAVELARKEVATIVRKMGEKAAYEAGVPNLHPDLISILGRLHFRTSYGQNVLWHSVEMAHMAAIIAEEVGADVAVARAGALLHDIGKTVSHEVAGTHVEIGIRILEKYGVDHQVVLAMRAHHEEYPYETPESIIVQVADAISGGRPGARRDSIENYVKRLTDLEAIATTLKGVDRAFAIAAGREIRVLVNPEDMTDFETHALARTIATTIEAKLRYPGEIKVHVIRETRVVSYAR
ncbi:ribonuclease Y [Candidatus Kaiserbacteria bacterium RIFCSPLOWO2_01_FULL_45_25]|uniref:Ribonuclease Y n=1 Tax=Candidatus Kaiserbacteria bacterium RIFCSPLOWO2_12_FULL_45_26 TaxID=1798525 RepID=A0A1F6FFJ7_9BACT|nr:MAG: ribonuclease Y [Candidatus Kaiserbacteria bacterium RIFCSPLOWO2_01_FULL_45_25]OGG84642.1 MAG: ribonuclease Y [Candidatus Kaiserbacteria bacterium RIFCSPLOWO2_12_FULL_45_26]